MRIESYSNTLYAWLPSLSVMFVEIPVVAPSVTNSFESLGVIHPELYL